MGAAARQVSSDPTLVPGGLAFAVLGVYVLKSGGYQPTTWYPGAVILLGLALMAVIARIRARALIGRAVVVAAFAFAFFTVCCFASISWSGDKGIAWDGANRTLLYFVLFALGAFLPWRTVTAGVLLVGFALVVTAVGFVELSRAASASDPTQYFQLGRFAASYGYQNAACAGFMMAFWPLLLAASRREVPVMARAISLGAACALPELALLCQSRASLVAVPITAAVYVALVPDRARTVVFATVPILAVAVTSGWLLHVFPAIRDGQGVRDAVVAARDAIAVSVIAGLAAGVLFGVLDLHVGAHRVRRVAGRLVLAAAALALAGGLAIGAILLRHPEARLQHAWTTFRTTQGQGNSRQSNFANGLGGNRYDIWRVALHEFATKPVRGVGVDNFASDYLRHRRSQEEPLYPHSVELRLLAQTGIVGTVLFASFLVAVALALRTLRRLSPSRRAVAGTLLTVTTYWLVHGSVDWFWEIPALGGVSFLCLGMACSLASSASLSSRSSRSAGLGVVLAVVVSTAAGVSLILPWLAAEETARAASSWRVDPPGAFARLNTARRLNPLSDQPDLIAGAIASRLGDRRRMASSFERALERNSDDWYAHLELAALASLERRPREAIRHLAFARALDPREPVIAEVKTEIISGHPISLEALDRIFLARTRL